jgi:hypothetical protein
MVRSDVSGMMLMVESCSNVDCVDIEVTNMCFYVEGKSGEPRR